MIDLHSHLLPGVDDGSPSLEHSAFVLTRFAAEGVRGVVCTPHLRASAARTAPVTQHRELLAQLRAVAPAGIDLHWGWEIMLDDPAADLSSPDFRLGESQAVLVEWERGTVPSGALGEVFRLRGQGLVPLVAHVERYRGITMAHVREWRDLGAVIQSDATILVAGGDMSAFAQGMLQAGVVDVLASDNHGDRRTLSTARWWLEEIGGAEQARLLTEENPRRLLADEPLLPVPPLRLTTTMFDRLRAFFRR